MKRERYLDGKVKERCPDTIDFVEQLERSQEMNVHKKTGEEKELWDKISQANNDAYKVTGPLHKQITAVKYKTAHNIFYQKIMAVPDNIRNDPDGFESEPYFHEACEEAGLE